ncbi:9089_t:CDS:2, partial [Gigaspora margarita]
SYTNIQEKQFVTCLTEMIWYIDMHGYQKFKDHSYHIPELFLKFFGYTNPELYKQLRKSFDINELNLYCQELAPYTTSSWILKIISIGSVISTNHASETLVRTVDQATTVQIYKQNIWITPVDKSNIPILNNDLIESLQAPINLIRNVFRYQSPKDDNISYENYTKADIKQKLHCLPDLVPEDDLHYKSFEEIYEQPEVNSDVKNTTNSNEEANQENIDEEDELNQSGSKSSEEKKPDKNMEESSKSAESDDIIEEFDTHKKDFINELFSKVFANDSLSCDAKIKKLYYSARIYPDVCIKYGCLNINKLTKNEYPCCSNCSGTSTNLKKSLMRTK